jgi:hypothetical protein
MNMNMDPPGRELEMHPQLGTGVRRVDVRSSVLQNNHDDLAVQLVAHVHDGLLALHGLYALACAGEQFGEQRWCQETRKKPT